MQGPQRTGDSSTGVNYADGEPICGTNPDTTSNNLLNQVDIQFPNNNMSSGRPTNASSSSHVVQNHNWWSFGESSSRLGPSDQVIGSKTDHPRPSDSYGFEEGQSGSNGMMLSGGIHIGSHTRNGPSFLRGSSSNHMLGHVNLGKEMEINGSGMQSSGVVIRHSNCESSLGSSSQTAEERNSGGLGSSCKRKALEGAPSHSFSSESPGCFFQSENAAWRDGLAQYGSSSSLSLSMPSQNSPNVVNQSGQPEPRFGMGGGRAVVAASAFPSSRSTETLSRSGRRLNPGQPHEPVAFSLSQSGSSVRQLPVTSPFVDPLDARAMPITGSSSSGESTEPSMIHLPALTRNIHQFAWNASSSSRTNSIPGEGFAPPWDAAARINSEQQPMFTPPVTETRNPAQDQFHFSFTRGNPSTSGDSPFAPRAGSSSGIHTLQPNPTWVTHPHHQSRISEVAPWSLFPSIESETATHGASLPIPTGPSVSSNEAAAAAAPSGSSSRSHRSRQRRSGLLLERQNDLLHLRHLGRSLAGDNDGRNRLISEIRQVLSAMRRGENLRFEDYMVFDPLIYHGMAEMQDRHRDMRLDVDNMSYEELLALGERIGDVSTGLSEEVIMKAMKQHKHTTSGDESNQEMEPCCVCQEEYVEGDDLGTLGCGHEFHTDCVKQWLMLKNLCPICKTVALST